MKLSCDYLKGSNIYKLWKELYSNSLSFSLLLLDQVPSWKFTNCYNKILKIIEKKNMLSLLNFPWKRTCLLVLKGNNSCKKYNFRIKVGLYHFVHCKENNLFKSGICKSFIEDCYNKPPYYYIGKRLGQILHSRLCMHCSSLNQHLYSKNSVDSPLWQCGAIETTEHY
jgi:hypothetical protein